MMAPPLDWSYASEVNYLSYLSNIAPQKAAVKDRPWGDLEDDARRLVVTKRR